MTRPDSARSDLPPFTGTLTAAHLAVIHAERDRWLRVGLSTARADRPAAEAAVRSAYTAAGLQPPGVMIWRDSPFGGCLASATIRHLEGRLGSRRWGRLWGQLDDQLGELLDNRLDGQLHGQLDRQLWGRLWGQLDDQLGELLDNRLDGQLHGQ